MGPQIVVECHAVYGAGECPIPVGPLGVDTFVKAFSDEGPLHGDIRNVAAG